MIYYVDEYGVNLYQINSDASAMVGDTVVVSGDEFRVKSRVFYPEYDRIVITLVMGAAPKTSVAESNDNSRQTQMHNAIIELSKRQDITEKKHRALSDQLSNVKRNVNNRIKQDKKDSND